MERRGRCCIARYAGVAGDYNMQKVDSIMLKYRPIAPKPGCVGLSTENRDTCVKTGRRKRKYVRDNNNRSTSNKICSNRRKRKVSSEQVVSGADPIVTLPLLPETPVRKEKKPAEPIWLSFNGDNREMFKTGHVVRGADPTAVRLVGSYLTVECLTETWVDECGLRYTDEEKMMNLEKDTCPGLITDGENRVVWVNKAYREMVGGVGLEGEMIVWLLMKQSVKLPVTCAAFTCRVSWVTYGKRPLTLPCDVWQMNGGGFAWRLDVNAALCLGR